MIVTDRVYDCKTKQWKEIQREVSDDIINQHETEIIKPVQRAMKLLSKGEYFHLDGQLCKAKTSISKGAILTLNTNYQVTNVEEELTKLNV